MFIACDCSIPKWREERIPRCRDSLLSRGLDETARSINLRLLAEPLLLNRDQVAERAKPSLADPAHHHEVFGTTERPVFLAMLNDAFGEAFSDSGEYFEFFRICGVEVDSLSVCRST